MDTSSRACCTCGVAVPADRKCRRCVDCQRLYFARWKAENRARLAEAKADYYRANQDRQAAWGADWRARRAGVRGALSDEQRAAIWAAFDGRCAYCGAGATTLDHLVPLARGGDHSAENTAPACLSCNASKRRLTPLEWLLVRPDVHSRKLCVRCRVPKDEREFYESAPGVRTADCKTCRISAVARAKRHRTPRTHRMNA
jgi:5-methylcytosine-specific restriction endonuclease McrA